MKSISNKRFEELENKEYLLNLILSLSIYDGMLGNDGENYGISFQILDDEYFYKEILKAYNKIPLELRITVLQLNKKKVRNKYEKQI